MPSSPIAAWQQRGLLYQVTDEAGLSKHLSAGPRVIYCGFDPTADSLHLGSLFPLLMLRRLQKAGHRVLALMGGATGLIGDPSGKSQERVLQTEDTVEKNLLGISKVVGKILDLNGPNPARLVNNYEWYKGFSYLSFLRDVGKHFTVNHMMAKESVRQRLEDREQGISYTEFSYMLLQAYDFYVLQQRMGCTMQIGGSDQWGNITAGCELIRRMSHAHGKEAPEVYGATIPLLTKADGSKFGKSEQGNIWLDAGKTRPYQFYQFLVQTADADVLKLLKILTDVDNETLAEAEENLRQAPEKRLPQKLLATELTRLIHGEEELQSVEHASQVFFGSDIASLKRQVLLDICTDVPAQRKTRASLVDGVGILELLVASGLFPSNGMARKEIQGGGVYLNNQRLTDHNYKVTAKDLIDSSCVVLRKGKKSYALVLFED